MLHITTPYGAHYFVDKEARITYLNENTGNRAIKPSGEWILLGLEHVTGARMKYVPFCFIATWLNSKPQLCYKNGNPQYTMRDRDHGTVRVHGNTKYHGIANIWVT